MPTCYILEADVIDSEILHAVPVPRERDPLLLDAAPTIKLAIMVAVATTPNAMANISMS